MNTLDLSPFYRSTVGFDRYSICLTISHHKKQTPFRPTTLSGPVTTLTALPWQWLGLRVRIW